MNIEELCPQLARNSDGIYFSEATRSLSYAPKGHEECFALEDKSFWFRHRNDCITAAVKKHPFNGTLLDIGGGNGYVAQRLIQQGLDVALIEPGPTGAHNARHHRGLPTVICSTVEDARIPAGSVGAIGLFDVLEHVDAEQQFLQSAAALLSPRGKLYLTVPCHTWLWSDADLSAGHFRRYTLRTLREALSTHFTVDYASYFFWPLVAPQLLLRSLPYRLGLTKGKAPLSSDIEHGTSEGLAINAISRLLAPESRAIAAGKHIPFGASAIAVATRR